MVPLSGTTAGIINGTLPHSVFPLVTQLCYISDESPWRMLSECDKTMHKPGDVSNNGIALCTNVKLNVLEETDAGGEEVFATFQGNDMGKIELDVIRIGDAPLLEPALTSQSYPLADEAIEADSWDQKASTIGPRSLHKLKLLSDVALKTQKEQPNLAIHFVANTAAGNSVPSLVIEGNVEGSGCIAPGVSLPDVRLERASCALLVVSVIEIVLRPGAFAIRVIRKNNGRSIFETPHSKGSCQTLVSSKFISEVLYRPIESIYILSKFPVDQIAAVAILRASVRVFDQGEAQRGTRVPPTGLLDSLNLALQE